MDRRGFLRTAGGVATATAAVAPASAQEEGGGATHTVDMTDGLVFEPADLTIAPGDTVVWDNVGGIDHSVTAYEDEIPAEATYFASGGFDGESAACEGWPNGEGHIAGGETYEHTFETTGTYEYFCIPHEAAGMVATIEVVEGGGGDAGEAALCSQDNLHDCGVPIQAHFVGLAAIVMVIVTTVFTFFQLKYGESPHTSGGN